VKKPRKVGTVESARFQSVSQEIVAEEERPNEIKDSYEEEQQLRLAGVGKARVEIPGPQEGFDRDAYSRVITSSQPSQPSQPSSTSQLPQSLQSQNLSSSQPQTPAPRHKYSSLIWDEDIEGVDPDSQEQPGSSSYKPSETPISKTVSTLPENSEVPTGTDFGARLGSTQVTSSEDFSLPGTVDSASAEPFFTQASYVDKGVQSSSVHTASSATPSSARNQIYSSAQESRDNLNVSTTPENSPVQLEVEASPLPDLGTSIDTSLHLVVTPASQGFQAVERSSGLPDTIESLHHCSPRPAEEQTSSPDLHSSSESSLQLDEARSKERELLRSPIPLDEIPSSPPNLLTSQKFLPLHKGSTIEKDTTYQHSQPSQSPQPVTQTSSSIEFGTQVPLEQVENAYLIPLSSNIRSSSIALPSVPLAER
jgi:hypothetical protein